MTLSQIPDAYLEEGVRRRVQPNAIADCQIVMPITELAKSAWSNDDSEVGSRMWSREFRDSCETRSIPIQASPRPHFDTSRLGRAPSEESVKNFLLRLELGNTYAT